MAANVVVIYNRFLSIYAWLQLELLINSIDLKKEMTASVCFKETDTTSNLLAEPLKILDHCKRPPEIMMIPLKCIAASAPSK